MTEGVIEDQAYADVLRSPGIPLSNYRSDPPTASLFPDAVSYPDFFNQNLVNDNRIIKQFLNNSHSNIRIFYYQLFRLGFEIETENNQGRNLAISFRRLVFYPEFEILFTHESQNVRDVYNNVQFKRFFAEFFQLISTTPNVNVERLINTYPIIDQVMIHILRSILLNQGINEEFATNIPTETVFGQFSSIIGLSITSYGNCWKFEDSDMFCYEQNERAIYLAYIVDSPPVAQVQQVNEMIAMNYYQQQPVPQIQQYQTNIKVDSPQYIKNYVGNSLNSYESYQPAAAPTIATTTIQSVYTEPKYESLYSNVAVENKTISAPITNSYQYNPSSYTSNYSLDNYTVTTNYNPLPVTTNFSTNYLSPNQYFSNPSTTTNTYTSTFTIEPASTTTVPTLSSYATQLLGNELKSMTLVEQNPYGSGSNASLKQSNPAKESMISEYFEFEAFTGEVTTEKMKVPRSQLGKESGILKAPVVHYNQDEQVNSMKFGNFGGLATSKTQQTATFTSISSPEKPYQYTSYTSPTSSYTYQSSSYTSNTLPSNYSSIDAYLEEIRKLTTQAIQPISSPTSYESTYKSSYDTYGTATTNPVTTAPTTTITETVGGECKPYDTSYLTSYTSPQTTYTTDYAATYSTQNYGLGDYKTTNNYTSSYSSPYLTSYSTSSFEKKPENDYKSSYTSSYSSFSSPTDYSFYSNNPYVSGNVSSTYQPITYPVPTTPVKPVSPPVPVHVQTKNPYLKQNTSSTDYLSRYGISSPSAEAINVTKSGTFQQSYGSNKQISNFERTSGSEYKPYTYQQTTTTYQQQHLPEQKPSSSYDRYNYQSYTSSSSSPVKSGYTPTASYAPVDYRAELSNSSIYDTINKVKSHHNQIQKPHTAVTYTQGSVKPVGEKEQVQYQYSSSSAGGYNASPSYVFNYRS